MSKKPKSGKKRAVRKPKVKRNEWTGTGWVWDGFAEHRRSTAPPCILSERRGGFVVPVSVSIKPLPPRTK